MTRTEFVVTLGEQQYAVERPWGTLPAGMALRSLSHVAVDSMGNVYVYQRSDPPLVVFAPDGRYLRSWGTAVIADAHGIFISDDDRIYLIDRDAHQILVFDTEGELLFAIGERHRPRHAAPFNHPTDLAVAADGEIYVSDGYGNSCVHRFAPDGEWLQSWGRPGAGPGEFTTPHAVWIDTENRVLIADREHNRVQLFTRDGQFLDAWGDFYHPMDIYGDASGAIYVTDQIPRLSRLDRDGRLSGRCRPVLYGAHGIWGDAAGNIFLAETPPMHQITRLVPIGQ
ncbi:MAG: peptidyl-alpha-hydroxyglycine alpha-amidating lyase family protein [Thermomicrobiales bacterium]